MSRMQTPRPAQQPAAQPANPSQLLDQILNNATERQRFMKTALEDRIEQIEEVLPPIMKGQAARLAKIAISTFQRAGAQLDKCPAADFVRCVREAAEMGLAVDGKLGHVVPYKSQWVFQPDYKGIVAVARRNGIIRFVEPGIVNEGDIFSYGIRNGVGYLDHTPKMGNTRPMCIAAYAILHLPAGLRHYEVMDFPALERIRMRSPAGAKGVGPWASDPDEMRKKTVIKRALKLYCDDPSIARMLDIDDQIEGSAQSNGQQAEAMVHEMAGDGDPVPEGDYGAYHGQPEGQP
jgi:recombination protein RecT